VNSRCVHGVLATGVALGHLLWPRPAISHAQITTTVQFDREIVRVLDDHCVACHVPDGLAFPLVTYEQTYAARWQIRQDALDRHMAPWAAVAGYGDFVNDNGLTQREIDFVTSWAESFGPRNNGAIDSGVAAAMTGSVPVQAHSDFERWALGKPDLLLPLGANTVAPQPTETFKRIVIDPKLKSARWLRGLEYKPGERRVVHSASFSVLETGQWLAGWTPWRGFAELPGGLAYALPAGSHIVAEIHYSAATAPVVDEGSLGLYFADQPSMRPVADLVLDAKVTSPLHGTPQKLEATTKLEADLTLLALQPTLRPGVQSIEVIAKLPADASLVLLFARDIPLQWPTPYIFRTPVSLPQGTDLSVIEHYAADSAVPPGGIALTVSGYRGAALAQRYKLAGTVRSVDAAHGRLVVEHGDIPGFMSAMTMSYTVGTHEALTTIAAGDQIQSDVVVSDSGAYLENIAVTRRAK
jgi:Cu/Ag efflux protein CusF